MSAHILVVDDEPQFLRALATNLRGAGYDVETATTAAEALSAAGLRPPDAVVLDLLLPDGTGIEVCRELRAWSDAPIVLVSAVGDDKEKIAALDAGADDYVTKPFAVGELLARKTQVAVFLGVDEPADALGQSLKLPDWLEPRRFEIEALLPNIHAPLELRGPNA